MSLSSHDAEKILSPFVKKYTDNLNNDNFDAAIKSFHPDAVIVDKGKKSFYGNDAIRASFDEFAAFVGKSTTSYYDTHYQGVKDYIIFSGGFKTETEKVGTVNGNFVQIWKREGDEYFIFHDEFGLVQ